jgi:uncharacterized BrkB/YihY/UPF0761 family membrane protein
MYQDIVIFAVFILIYSTVAGAVERTWISGAIIFTAFGLLIGPIGLDFLQGRSGSHQDSGGVDAGTGSVHGCGRRRHGCS